MRRCPLARLAALSFSLALATLAASPTRAAPPAPPDQVAYSGVLVDTDGVPLAGPVDLTARLYDAASGGALLFKQSFSGVELSDGHYTLHLGPTGSASDSPMNPLTTSLRTALTGNLVAGLGRFVEVTLDSNPPLPRVQLVLVPYAMRADHAATSDVATQSLDTQAVNGLDAGVLTELFEHYNEDGGPPASDSREGTTDTDGDGDMNFVDPDNDNDGRSDTVEVDAGTNINLVTPFSVSLSPNSGFESQMTPVTVSGTGFLPGLTAVLGSQSFTPSVTPTSFVLNIGPQPIGSVDLSVTNPNGETTTKTGAFSFVATPPPPPIPLPNGVSYVAPLQIVARGEQLLVSGVVSSGSNRNRYAADTVADGTIAFDLGTGITGPHPAQASWNSSRVIHAVRGWAFTDQIQLLRDDSGDNLLSTSEAIVIESPGVDPRTQSPSLVFDASDRPGGAYLRNVGGVISAVAFHDRDGDGSFGAPNEVVTIEPVGGATDHLGEAAFDPSGRLAYVYYNALSGVLRAAWDRNGDGDFADTVGGTPEIATVASTATPFCFGMTFDAAGRLAVLFGADFYTPTLRRDLNGDGDFVDAGESLNVGGIGFGYSFACDVGASATTDRVFVVHNAAANGNNAQPRVLSDLNDDGDYVDAGESETISPTPVNGPFAVTQSPTGIRLLTGSGLILGPLK